MVANPKAPDHYRVPGPYTWPLDEDGGWSGNLSWSHEAMTNAFDRIASMRTSRVHFLGSMTDLFHENASMESTLRFLASEISNSERSQTLVIATKRQHRALEWQRKYFPHGLPRHLILLLTVCTQEEADRKIRTFRQIIGRKGLHIEPQLERIDVAYACFDGSESFGVMPFEWLACGPENGPRKRPFSEEWARDLREQCRVAGIKFFFKAGLLDGQANEEIDS